ncbi:MAG: ABC transporter permease [Opitutales bacterium]|nr:ABC transporter permease [Opitutales bacterium]
MRWSKIQTVALSEFRRVVWTRSFLIGLVLPIVLYGGLFAIMIWMEGKADISDQRVVVIDRSGIIFDELALRAEERNEEIAAAAENGRPSAPRYLLEARESSGGAAELDALLLDLAAEVRAGQIFAFVVIGPEIAVPDGEASGDGEARFIHYFSNSPTALDLPRWLRQSVEGVVETVRFVEAGMEEERVRALLRHAAFERFRLPERGDDGEIASARDREEFAILVPMGLVLLLFIAVQMASPVLLNSIVEEKMQRIAEVLLSSVSAVELFAGKLLAGAAVGVTFSLTYLFTLAIAVLQFGDSIHLPPTLYAWFVVFLLLSLLGFGALFAAVSALCQDLKDAQNYAGVIVIVLMVPMFLAIVSIQSPTSTVVSTLSMVPPFSPSLMMMRLAIPPGPALWQVAVAILANLAFAVFAVWLAARIFRIGILSYGKTPSFGEILRWLGRDG